VRRGEGGEEREEKLTMRNGSWCGRRGVGAWVVVVGG